MTRLLLARDALFREQGVDLGLGLVPVPRGSALTRSAAQRLVVGRLRDHAVTLLTGDRAHDHRIWPANVGAERGGLRLRRVAPDGGTVLRPGGEVGIDRSRPGLLLLRGLLRVRSRIGLLAIRCRLLPSRRGPASDTILIVQHVVLAFSLGVPEKKGGIIPEKLRTRRAASAPASGAEGVGIGGRSLARAGDWAWNPDSL